MISKITTLYLSLPSNFVISIILKGGVSFREREELLLRAYVPGIKITGIVRKNIINNPDLTINYCPSKGQKFSYDDNYIIIHDDWSKEIPVYFFHLIYSISHHVLLKKGYYTIHSACVGKENQWSLLLGHTGVGKTTVMLDLLYNYRFKMFSSNKTIVRFKKNFYLEAIAGTATITCKDSDRGKLKSVVGQTANFVSRFACNLPNKYFASKNKVKIGRVYFVKLNPSVEECVSLNNFESMVSLYPFFLDYINSGTILFSGKDFYDGAPITTEIKKKILSSLKISLISLDVYSLNGSLDFISKTIEKNYGKI
ncbi:hypothetical protein EOL99_03095 [Candidatus Falkowbacteria bacterium]|nr:hypothetical protein [Candidatus Falkowbacteria bacterium]